MSISGITDTEEERIKESAAYVAKRNLFATGEGVSVSKVAKSTSEEEHHEKKSRKVAIRESAERVALKKTVKRTEMNIWAVISMGLFCLVFVKYLAQQGPDLHCGQSQ